MTITIQERVASLKVLHGSLRAAARASGVDVGYLRRLWIGEKSNPSDETLEKIGLQKRVIYVLRQ